MPDTARPAGPPPALSRPQLATLALFAIALRVLAVTVPRGVVPGGVPFNPDERWYQHLAAEWAAGHGFDPGATGMTISLARWPGYPAALGTLYRIAGDSPWVVWTYHIALGAGACVVLAWIAARLTAASWGPRAGRLAGWCTGALAAGHPFLLAQMRPAMTEAQYTFLAVAALALLLRCLESPSRGRAIALGVVTGLACLTRASGVVMVPALAAGLLLTGGTPRHRAAVLAGMLAALALTVSPWAVRNALVWHQFVPLGTGGGYLFFSGNSPYGAARFLARHPVPELPYFNLMRVHDDGWFVGQALAWIAADPGRFVQITLAKLAVLWKVWPAWRSWAWTLPAIALYAVPPALAALGLARGWRCGGVSRAVAAASLTILLVASALFALTIPELRYRVPTIDVLLWVWTGVALGGARQRLRPKGTA